MFAGIRTKIGLILVMRIFRYGTSARGRRNLNEKRLSFSKMHKEEINETH